MHPQFLEDMGHVPLDGIQGDHQPIGNLLVRVAVNDQLEHFQFTFGKRFDERLQPFYRSSGEMMAIGSFLSFSFWPAPSSQEQAKELCHRANVLASHRQFMVWHETR